MPAHRYFLFPTTIANEAAVSVERLRELFICDFEQGVLKWVLSGGRPPGTVAGRVQSYGYWRVQVDRRGFAVHRIIINRNPADNRIENLRLATPSENTINADRYYKPDHLRGTLKIKDGMWKAKITKDRKIFNLGVFNTAEEAHEAYRAKAVDLHGEFFVE